MTEAPLKGEEPGQDLRELTLKQQHGSLMKTRLRVFLFVCLCVIMLAEVRHHGDEGAKGESADRDDDAA